MSNVILCPGCAQSRACTKFIAGCATACLSFQSWRDACLALEQKLARVIDLEIRTGRLRKIGARQVRVEQRYAHLDAVGGGIL